MTGPTSPLCGECGQWVPRKRDCAGCGHPVHSHRHDARHATCTVSGCPCRAWIEPEETP